MCLQINIKVFDEDGSKVAEELEFSGVTLPNGEESCLCPLGDVPYENREFQNQVKEAFADKVAEWIKKAGPFGKVVIERDL